ncbi:MAG: P22 phage major capsid protein family protein [Dehalococcoidia bacterium]
MATNTLGNYNEDFFAQEALIQLEKVMGMAGRVFRGYDSATKAKGDTIQLRRPASFTATSAPASDSDLATESVSITLNQWDEVKFSLTDKDLSLTAPQIVTDHIRPAAVALADKIDQNLASLYIDIPWIAAQTATPALADIAAIRKIMFDNKVPLNDKSNLNYMIDGATELAYLNALAAAGQQANTQDPSLREGSLGRLYGFDVWANQNTPSHTSGVAADAAGAVDLTAGYAAGLKAMHIDGITSGATLLEGDTFSIAGHTQRYVLTADAVETTGDADIAFEPGLTAAVADDAVVTFTITGSAKVQTLAFHRNAFALATAPLSSMGNELGARIAVASDPITNISLRSRIFYMPDESKVKVALDVLYGFKTLDRNLAVRGYDA